MCDVNSCWCSFVSYISISISHLCSLSLLPIENLYSDLFKKLSLRRLAFGIFSFLSDFIIRNGPHGTFFVDVPDQPPPQETITDDDKYPELIFSFTKRVYYSEQFWFFLIHRIPALENEWNEWTFLEIKWKNFISFRYYFIRNLKSLTLRIREVFCLLHMNGVVKFLWSRRIYSAPFSFSSSLPYFLTLQ